MSEKTGLAGDENKIKLSIRSGFPFTIVSCALPPEAETRIGNALASFLRFAGRGDLVHYIEYCVRELAVNAKKANTKRVYFIEKGLDINDSADYELGMRTFKADTLGNLPRYIRLQKDAGLYVKIKLMCRMDAVQIEVCNNAAASRIEMERVRERLAISRRFLNLEELFGQVLDDSEGAGLGLAVLMLMLRRLGLEDGSFDLTSTETETAARVVIPLADTALDAISGICASVTARTDSLPCLPESVAEVRQTLCAPQSDTADTTDAAVKIAADPVLTACLLRAANSAADSELKKIGSVSSAARILGTEGLRSLLDASNSVEPLDADAERMRKLRLHCRKAAYYAFNLGLNFFDDARFAEDAYLGGLLHDIGKFVFADASSGFYADGDVHDPVFEDVRAGLNHAEIGALLAEKWNFPVHLAAAVRFHHTPDLAPEAYRTLADTVHLADVFCGMEAGTAVFEQADSSSLARLGITKKPQAEELVRTFSSGFKQQQT